MPERGLYEFCLQKPGSITYCKGRSGTGTRGGSNKGYSEIAVAGHAAAAAPGRPAVDLSTVIPTRYTMCSADGLSHGDTHPQPSAAALHPTFIPSMVRLVSAMFVAMTTFRAPWGVGSKILACRVVWKAGNVCLACVSGKVT
jgi:hypothetical protein